EYLLPCKQLTAIPLAATPWHTWIDVWLPVCIIAQPNFPGGPPKMSTPAAKTNVRRAGRHFLQIPGPTNVPDRILRAIDNATLDHRGPELGRLARDVLDGLKFVFKTRGPVVMWPGSGTGAWEAALVNTLSPGDRVLMFETGQFALLWREMAQRLGLDID